MTGRQLGTMQIENDVITVTERRLEVSERTAIWRACPEELPSEYVGLEIAAEWSAKIEDRLIAYGALLDTAEDAIVVAAHVCVHPDARGLGIGRFMCRFAVDLAIRNRKRGILVTVDNDAARAIALDLE